MENAIPGQSANQAAQVSQNNVSPDSLKAVKATKKADDGNVGVRIAQGNNMHRKYPCADRNFTGYMCLKLAAAISNNGFQFEQFIEFCVDYTAQLLIALNEGLGRKNRRNREGGASNKTEMRA